MGKKGTMQNFKTVDDYINNQSSKAQLILKEIRKLIKETVPECLEIENYKVPAFTLVPKAKPEKQLMMVAYANYVSFYPFEATINHFSYQLSIL